MFTRLATEFKMTCLDAYNMTTRREINSKHESAVIEAALLAHNEQVGTAFVVESRPDPPDAILVNGIQRTWMEHTDAFYPGWAEDLTSYAATDKIHRPMRKGFHMDMDNQVAEVFAKVVLEKFNNKSYKSAVNQYGPGILVVGIESPWLDGETVQAINEKWAELGSPDLSTVFGWVYLGFDPDPIS
jgi:hypothetical protein